MLSKIWKKVLLFVLIVACLFNIMMKIIQRESLREELESTLNYFNNNKNSIIANSANNSDNTNSLYNTNEIAQR